MQSVCDCQVTYLHKQDMDKESLNFTVDMKTNVLLGFLH